MDLLKELCSIHAPSGEEKLMKDFVLGYVHREMSGWAQKPEIVSEGIHDNLILVFGQPKIAIFCHMDSVGFTLQYNKRLIPVGSPDDRLPTRLKGVDTHGQISEVNCLLLEEESGNTFLEIEDTTNFERGTSFTFASNYTEDGDIIRTPFLDNRAGVWLCLNLARKVENTIIVFTTYEEHGGGSVEFLAPMIYRQYGIRESLICDMTWSTQHIVLGSGPVISLRDKYIPRKLFLDKILKALREEGISFQLEVESSGSSDGGYLQKSSVPMDWCFIGACVDNIHSNSEQINSKDLYQTLELYYVLIKRLNQDEIKL
jgi:putative aminopeptidase FrvX